MRLPCVGNECTYPSTILLVAKKPVFATAISAIAVRSLITFSAFLGDNDTGDTVIQMILWAHWACVE